MKYLKFNVGIIFLLLLTSVLNVSATPAYQTDKVVFAVIGDYGSAGPAARDVANLVKGWQPNFIVTVGDNNYPNGAAYSIDKNIGQYYHNYIYKYKGVYGAGSSSRRFFPALGNHDWHKGSVVPYTNYFTLPGNERFYEFAYGPVHFFVLDSMKEEPYGNTPTSAQAKWLKTRMTASTFPFQIVITHYPPYSSGKHGSVPFMQWKFKEWGADAVLAGHNHVYERLNVNGLDYFVNGLGGDEVGYFRAEILPESRFRYNENFGAMRVEATSTSLKFQFYSRSKVLIDEYIIGEKASSIPVAASIQRADSNSTSASVVNYEINFSESVQGVDITDFILTTSGVEGASIADLSGSGALYSASINTGTGSGTLRLDLVDDNSITNETGEALGGQTIGDGNFIGETYIISKEIEVPTPTPTPPALTAPTLLSPANNSSLSSNFIFTWTKISAATRYHLLIDNNENFSSPEWNVLRQETSYQIASMTRKTVYYWKVRAKDINGNWSAWSTVFKLTVP